MIKGWSGDVGSTRKSGPTEAAGATEASSDGDLARAAAARDRADAAVDRLAAAQDRAWASRAVDQLTEALGTSREIGVALGILVEQSDCTPAEAFIMLTERSPHSNVRVRELARQIVDRRRS